METKIQTILEKYQAQYDIKLSPPSQVVTYLAWEMYPSNAFNVFVEDIKGLSKELSQELSDNGVKYTVLWSEKTSLSGYYKENIQVDCEEWYSDLSEKGKILIEKLKSNEQIWDAFQDLLQIFQSNIEKEILICLEKEGIAFQDLDALFIKA